MNELPSALCHLQPQKVRSHDPEIADSATGQLPSASVQPPPPPRSVSILGIGFDALTAQETLARIEDMIASRRPHYVITANVDFLVQSLSDMDLRRVLLDSPLVLCDSTPLLWTSRWLGCPLPERVAGSDLAPELLKLAARRHYRLFLLGACPEANAAAVERVRHQYPGIVIAGSYSPPFRPLHEMNHEEILERVRDASPDILFVAFGCPKAEKWMAMHYRSLNVPVMIGVGATIDFLAGRMKRAPVWMRHAGLEWAFRLCQEPRRLWRRYATDLFRFGTAIVAQKWATPPLSAIGTPHSALRTPHSALHTPHSALP